MLLTYQYPLSERCPKEHHLFLLFIWRLWAYHLERSFHWCQQDTCSLLSLQGPSFRHSSTLSQARCSFSSWAMCAFFSFEITEFCSSVNVTSAVWVKIFTCENYWTRIRRKKKVNVLPFETWHIEEISKQENILCYRGA